MTNSPRDILRAHLPEAAVTPVEDLLKTHRIHLRITRDRSTKLGDFKPAINGASHRMSINGGLNPNAFLLVFLHELAHLLVYKRYGRSVSSHGSEWKSMFGQLIRHFLIMGCFDRQLSGALTDYSYRVKASGLASVEVQKILRDLDEKEDDAGWIILDELGNGEAFAMTNGRIFIRIEKRRTRCLCECVASKRKYLVQASQKVLPVRLDVLEPDFIKE